MNIKKDSKLFYKYVKSKSNARTSVGPTVDENGLLISDDGKIGDLLNDFECIESKHRLTCH